MVRAAKLRLDLTLPRRQARRQRPTTEVVHARPSTCYGPGDIVGIDKPRRSIKDEPRDWITNFEPNYLAYVEFYDEDFPWRYTPASGRRRQAPAAPVDHAGGARARRRVRRWQGCTGKPLPYFELAATADPAKLFPRPDELWAWAHVHANVDLSRTAIRHRRRLDKLKATLGKNPDRRLRTRDVPAADSSRTSRTTRS